MGAPVNFYNRVIGIEHYWPVNGSGTTPNTVSEDSIAQAAYNFTVIGMYVSLRDAPNGTRTFTLRKNSTDTAITAELSGLTTTAYVTGSVSFSEAHFDTISFKEVEDDSPVLTQYSISLIVTAEAGRQPLVFGKRILNNLNAFNYPILNDCQTNWLTNDASFPPLEIQLRYTRAFSTTGILKNYRMLVTSASTNTSHNLIFYMADRQNLDTWITLPYSSVYGENLADGETVSFGTLLYGIGANQQFFGAFARAGSCFQTLDFYPDTTTNRVMGTLVGMSSNGNPRYYAASGAGGGFTSTTAGEPFIVVPIAGTITNLYATLNSVTGSSAVTVTMRKNFTDTDLTVTFSSTSTGSNTTYGLSVVQGDRLSLKTLVEGGITRTANIGWVFDCGFTNVTPLFFSYSTPSATTLDGTSVPINFYSRADNQPVNFYSLP